MANRTSNSKHRMSMKVLQDPRKPSHGAPKILHRQKKPLKSSIKKVANGTRTGDVISDDSDGDDEGDSGINDSGDDEDEDDDADVFALSGGPRIKSNANGRLAGRMSDDVDMFDAEQTVAGAERESTNDSDEEDYAAVDEISDSDDSNADADEQTVLRKAERDLIAEFQSTEKPRAAKAMANEMDDMCLGEESGLSRRTSMQSETSTDADLDFGLDFTQDPFGGLNSNDSLYQELIEDAEGQFDGDLASWRIPDVHPDSLMMHGGSRDSSVFSTHTAKKVRFDENTSTRSRTSSLSSEEADPRDAYPDLLDSADTPIGRSSLLLVNMDADGQMDQMDTESLYDFDFEDEYEKAAFEIDQSDSEDSSSDDSEEGDTTDEETADEHAARVRAIQKASGRLNGSDSPTPVPQSQKRPTTNSKTTRGPVSGRFSSSSSSKVDKRPKSGTFVHDPSVASVSANVKGSGVKLVCPTNPPEKERAYWERARRAMGSRDGSPGASVSWTRTTPRTASIPQRPFTAKSTLGTMFDGNLDFLRSNDQSGIAEDILKPIHDRSAVQSPFSSRPPSDNEMSEDESSINLDDFVQISDSDDDHDDIDVVDDTEADEATDLDHSSFSRPGTANPSLFSPTSTTTTPTGGMTNFLDHFDQQRGLVASFRNNQHHAKTLSSLAANPARRAMTSEANALQKGRKGAGSAGLTPGRKKRRQSMEILGGGGVRKGGGMVTMSPLARKGSLNGGAPSRRRGASLSQALVGGGGM